MTALKYPTMRSHLAKLEDILISPVFVHLSGPAVNRKSFILPLLSRRPKVATPHRCHRESRQSRRSAIKLKSQPSPVTAEDLGERAPENKTFFVK